MRYALAIGGPASSSAAQFVLSLLLLHGLSQDEFGVLSFLLLIAQFGLGIWSALFVAPLPALNSDPDVQRRDEYRRSILTTNLAGALAGAGLLVLLGRQLDAGVAGSWLFAAYGSLSLLRSVARALAYLDGRPVRTAASDVLYSVLVLSGAIASAITQTHTLTMAAVVLSVATVGSFIPFGREYFVQQFARIAPRDVRHYSRIWRQHTGWSLFGVVTTEGMANAHSYLVTAMSGPAAFAPLAASLLMLRPLQVLMNALVEFERTQLARHIVVRDIAAALNSVSFFRFVLAAGWIATAAAMTMLMMTSPRLVVPEHYRLDSFAIAMSLWMAVAAARAFRTPESALLQAAGEFRVLAAASAVGAAVSVAAVLLLQLAAEPVWSIVGIFLGELVGAALTARATRSWRQHITAPPAALSITPAVKVFETTI